MWQISYPCRYLSMCFHAETIFKLNSSGLFPLIAAVCSEQDKKKISLVNWDPIVASSQSRSLIRQPSSEILTRDKISIDTFYSVWPPGMLRFFPHLVVGQKEIVEWFRGARSAEISKKNFLCILEYNIRDIPLTASDIPDDCWQLTDDCCLIIKKSWTTDCVKMYSNALHLMFSEVSWLTSYLLKLPQLIRERKQFKVRPLGVLLPNSTAGAQV